MLLQNKMLGEIPFSGSKNLIFERGTNLTMHYIQLKKPSKRVMGLRIGGRFADQGYFPQRN